MEWRALDPGEKFAGRYHIEDVLGIGGFSHVYRATQIGLDRVVALKVLHPSQSPAADSEDGKPTSRWLQRFEREAKLISNLRDPHTITMYDYGHTEAGMSYMVFEYISGQSLEQFIDASGPMSPQRVVTILRQCLSSIQEAHAMGILHRDLKPANIMVYDHVGRRDQVKVLDFGIAKPMQSEEDITSADLTKEGTIIGTPRYMSPEQLLGESVGPPSDLYSLGLVAYELLTAQKAVSGDSMMQVISRQVDSTPIELPAQMDIPARFHQIIEQLLAKEPHERYQSAGELMEALEHWDKSQAFVADAPSPKTSESHQTHQLSESDLDQITSEDIAVTDAQSAGDSPQVSRRLIGACILAAAVVAVMVGALFLVDADEDPPDGDELAIDEPVPQPVVEEPSSGGGNEVEQPPQMAISTQPSGAAIRIDGVEAGSSPTSIDLDEHRPPLTVSAKLKDGRTTEAAVETATSQLELVFDDRPPQDEPEVTKPDPEPAPRLAAPDPSPPTAVETAPAPAPVEDSETDEEPGTGPAGPAPDDGPDEPATPQPDEAAPQEAEPDQAEPDQAEPDEDESDDVADPYGDFIPLD